MFPRLSEELQALHVVLASSSQTRENLLKRLHSDFEVCAPKFKEDLNPTKYFPANYVLEIALGKVLSVEELLAQKGVTPDIIIGADTMVEYRSEIYGKPKNREEAIEFLTKFTSSEEAVVVHTGVVMKFRKNIVKFVESTYVYMDRLSKKEILDYVESGESMNCAGGFAIQGLAGCFINSIKGDYNNVTGFPLRRVRQELLKALNII